VHDAHIALGSYAPQRGSSDTMNTETGRIVEAERMNIYRAAPALARALVGLEREIRIDPVLRELVKLRASILNGCAYCIDMHTKDARKAGESEQRLYAVAAWQEAPFFSERERAALALTDAVTLVADTHVPAVVYDEAARQFEPEELGQLIWQIVAINAWSRIAITTRQTAGEYEP
jgi:AhpD family alkylhydroperoxidase